MCKKVFTLALIIMFGIFGVAQSQESNDALAKTRGLFLNIHGNGNYFNSNIGDDTIGGLAGAKLGLSFKRISIFLQSNNAILKADNLSSKYQESDLGVITFGLGGRYHFLSENAALIPYAEASLDLQYFTSPEDGGDNALGYGGYGPSLGGGVQYFFSQTLALDVGINLMYGYYDQTATNPSGDQVDVNSLNAQLNIGFSWYPFNSL